MHSKEYLRDKIILNITETRISTCDSYANLQKISTFLSLTLRFCRSYSSSSPQTAVMAIWGFWIFSDYVVNNAIEHQDSYSSFSSFSRFFVCAMMLLIFCFVTICVSVLKPALP